MPKYAITFETTNGQTAQEVLPSGDDAALAGRLFRPDREWRKGQVVTRIRQQDTGRIVPLSVTVNSQLAQLSGLKVA